jgi:hypothetical protein
MQQACNLVRLSRVAGMFLFEQAIRWPVSMIMTPVPE